MQAISAIFNRIKDGYLRAVQWVVDHPQKTIWSAFGAIVVALVF